jgi:hypothetical protein
MADARKWKPERIGRSNLGLPEVGDEGDKVANEVEGSVRVRQGLIRLKHIYNF